VAKPTNFPAGGVEMIPLCIGHTNASPNGFNVLKVVTRGGTHQLFVNNVLFCTATDHTYAVGAVMPMVQTTGKAGEVFSIDSVQIQHQEVVPPAPSAPAMSVAATVAP
jgi:hypothetical protein